MTGGPLESTTGTSETRTEVACPLCDASDASPWIEGEDVDYADPRAVAITDARYGDTGRVVRCARCRLAFRTPRPSEAQILGLYRDLEDPDYEAESASRRTAFRRILARLTHLNGGAGTLLDVGAATGLLLLEARSAGWQGEGVEPSRWAARAAIGEHHLPVHCGTIDSVKDQLECDAYDAVIAADVIEHVVHPGRFLDALTARVRRGGWLTLVTPDIDSVARRLLGARWWHFRPAHLQYFSLATLEPALRDRGFEIARRHRYTWHFTTDYWASRLGSYLSVADWTRRKLSERDWGRRVLSVPFPMNFFDSLEIYARRT